MKDRPNATEASVAGVSPLDVRGFAAPPKISQETSALDRRRAVGVEGLDRLQAPGLALLALLLGPDDRLPVGCEDQARAGVGDLGAVAAGLVDIKGEGMLDR